MSLITARSLVATAALLALLGGCGGPSEAELIKSAKQHLANKEPRAAAIQLKTALQKNPASAEARFMLGTLMLEQGDAPSALVEINKAQAAGYDEDKLLPKLARAILANGKPKEVIARFADRTLADPSLQAELRTAVALAHARLNQRTEAEAAIESALKSDPKHRWALLTKARIAAAKGDYDGALALTDQAMAGEGINGDALMFRGSLLLGVKNDMSGAIAAAREALKDPQQERVARATLVALFISQRKLPEARTELEALKKVFPKHPDTYLSEAQLAFVEKDYPRAAEIMQLLLRLAPNNTRLLVFAGVIDMYRGSLVAAETHLGKAVQFPDSGPMVRKLLAENYLRMGQPEKALNALRSLLETTQDGDALALAGQAYLQRGDVVQAEAVLSAALRLKPQDAEVGTALALTDLVKGNADAAMGSLRDIAARDTGEVADLALISSHLKRREFEPALKALEALDRKLPGRASTAHLRGTVLRAQGDVAGARAAWEAALKLEPTHYASIAKLASLDVAEKKYADARTRLEAAVKTDPRNAAARLALADVLERSGVPAAQVAAALDEAIKAVPADPGARVAKIALLTRGGDVKGALTEAQSAVAAFPEDADVLDAVGRAQINADEFQQAINTFNKLAQARPRSAAPHVMLADLHGRRKDALGQMASLRRAFELEPLSSDVHLRYIGLARSTKDPKPLIEVAKAVQKRAPASGAGYLLEGDGESMRKNWPAALVAYRAALGKTDVSSMPQIRVFEALEASGKAAEAEQFSAQWLKDHPQDGLFLARLGDRAIERKDYALAERRFRQIVESDARNASAYNNLAWLLAERGDKEAVAMAEKAVALSPGKAPLLDTLAKALAVDGQLARAITAQQEAVALAPATGMYRVALARLYLKAGEKTKALAEIDRVAAAGTAAAGQAELVELRKAASH